MLEGYEVPVVCPACSMVNKRTVGWLQSNTTYTCDGCGAQAPMDPGYVERATRSVQADITRLRAAEDTTHGEMILADDEELLKEKAEIEREEERFPGSAD